MRKRNRGERREGREERDYNKAGGEGRKEGR